MTREKQSIEYKQEWVSVSEIAEKLNTLGASHKGFEVISILPDQYNQTKAYIIYSYRSSVTYED